MSMKTQRAELGLYTFVRRRVGIEHNHFGSSQIPHDYIEYAAKQKNINHCEKCKHWLPPLYANQPTL